MAIRFSRSLKAKVLSTVAALFVSLSIPNAFAETGSFNGESVSTLGPSGTLKIEAERLSGTGTVIFDAPLTAIGESSSHRVSFLLAESGSMTLVLYANSESESGLNIEFSRTGKALRVVATKGTERTDLSRYFPGVDASRLLDYQIDIHNDENPAHVLVWKGFEPEFNESNAIINSESRSQRMPSRGEGIYKALVLKNAFVFKAQSSEPKFKHEH